MNRLLILLVVLSLNLCSTESFANPLLVPNASATAETGNDFNDGTAMCNPTDGIPPFTFLWSTGDTTQVISGLNPGDYSITVTDSLGVSASETVTVLEFVCQELSIDISKENVTCFDSCNGSITVNNVINGTSPFIYNWSNGNNQSAISGLCEGMYSVSIVDNVNCQVSDSFIIIQPDILIPNVSSTNETGYNFNDGTASCNPQGGKAPYNYIWSNGLTSQTITGLSPGEYSLTITDDALCTVTGVVIIEEFVCPTDMEINSVSIDPNCFESCDGLITIVGVNNGVEPFEYAWSDGQSGQTAFELCASTYRISITDAVNCVVADTISVQEPEQIILNINYSDESAFEAENGDANVSVLGGTPPFSFLWSTGQTTQSISGLSPGVYSITVTDANDCSKSDSFNIAEYICNELILNAIIDNSSCSGECNGAISIDEVSGGGAPFFYLWSNGQTSSYVNNLCAGEYVVTVIDNYNCSINGQYIIDEPDLFEIEISSTDETSFGGQDGTASVVPMGGEEPYIFEWSNGEDSQEITGLTPGNYSVTVTDANDCSVFGAVSVLEFGCETLTILASQADVNCYGDCNGSVEIIEVENALQPLSYSWASGNDMSLSNNLCAGLYFVTIVDANNCTTFSSYEIVEPSELFANGSFSNESANDANDGFAEVNPIGGTSPYSFLWDNGETTQSISGLEPGLYSVIITDGNGCTATESFTILEFECPELIINSVVNDALCYGDCSGSVNIISVSNAEEPISFQWETGDTISFIDELCPDLYSLEIIDANNCGVNQDFSIYEPNSLVLVLESTDETSFGANDGSANASLTGGVPPYDFLWSNGEIADNISNLSPGIYFLTATDANGCTVIDSVNIIESICPELLIASTQTDVLCFGSCTGSIDIMNVENSTPPLSYEWAIGSTDSGLINLCEGYYSLTVTDSNNCTISHIFYIEEPSSELNFEIISTDETVVDGNDGTAVVIAQGGTSPYNILWSNGETNDTISDLIPGDYGITLTDANGCSVIDSFTIEESFCQEFDFYVIIQNASCNVSDGMIEISEIANGTPPFTYIWTPNVSNTNIAENLEEGIYIIEIIDANGCTAEIETYVIVDDTIEFSIDEITNISDSNSFGSISISTNNTGNYSFSWVGPQGFSANTEDIDQLIVGCYFLTILDEETGCSVEEEFCIENSSPNNNLDLNDYLKVYPNPVVSSLIIEVDNMEVSDGELTLLDVAGTVIYSDSVSGKLINIDLSNENNGVYILMLKSNNGIFIKKIIID